jgi:hypothetical protein
MILSLNGLVKLYSPQLEAVMLLLLCSSCFSLRSSLSVTHYDDEEEISFASSSLSWPGFVLLKIRHESPSPGKKAPGKKRSATVTPVSEAKL